MQQTPDSPARSGSGRLRNFGAMGEAKIRQLAADMEAYRDQDPDGYQAVITAAQAKGIEPFTTAPEPRPAKRLDPMAQPMGMPTKPMLAHDAKSKKLALPEGDPDWIMEPKLDGWRFLFYVTTLDGEKVVQSFAGRNGSNRTGELPLIEAELAKLPAGIILDGEVVKPGGTAADVAALGDPSLQFVAFDILRVEDESVTFNTYDQRRGFLEAIASMFDRERVRIIPQVEVSERTFAEWLAMGFEGAVVKRRSARYRCGARSADFIKHKPQADADCTIIGIEEGENGWAGKAGVFNIRLIESGIETTCAIPTQKMRDAVTADSESYIGKAVEIRHHGIMDSGKPRHPVFSRMRPDRDAS